MKKRNYCAQSSLFCRSNNGENILYQTIRSFHIFLRRWAAVAVLVGFCTAVAQATPSIVEVRTAAPNVIVAVVQTDITYEYGTTSGPDNIDTAAGPGHWQVNGGSPTAVHRYSVPWDELPQVGADPNLPNYSYPVTTRHRIYLQLSSPLQEGATYTISNPSYGSMNLTFSARTAFCESIKVNQVGYSKRSTSRYANFGVYMGDGGSLQFNPAPTYKVYNESTGAILTNGTAVFITNDTANASSASSGEYVYRLSLNYVPEGGPYYVSVDGAGRSRSFGIGDNYSSNIAYVTLRGMYLHRCGIALTQPFTAFTHAICHTNIYDDRSTHYDDDNVIPQGTPPMFTQGGYHDAGDMDQSAAHYLISVLMLSFYEAFPNLFVDNQYNIPESGNGIPDFLDETMWGLKVWEYLQVTNTSDGDYGGVRGGFDPNGYPKYGLNDAANDVLAYGTMNVQPDVTGQVAGIFAQASRLIRRYDSAHADALLSRAQLAWNWLSNRGYTSQNRASVMYAALQLYLATGNASYHGFFQTLANNVILSPNGFSGQDGYECGNNYYFCQNAHFISYLLPNVPNANATLVQNLKNKILGCAQTGTFMGPPPETQPYPQGVTKFMAWGAATAQGRYADTWMYACLLTNDTATLQRYTNAVAQYADFSLGLNPMNISYYTGLGTDQPNSPLDCNSYYTKYGLSDGVTSDNHRDASGKPIGNVPGILLYGPTDGNSGTDYQMAIWKKLWPAWDSLPAQRHHADGWSLVFNNEFTVQETMVWNTLMYSFLYPAAGGGTNPPPPATTAQRATAAITIDGSLSEAGWIITNTVTRTIIGTDNNTVTFGALWDDTYLYVGAKVIDANLFSDSAPYPWQDDAIEIYIDGNHNRGTSYDAYDRQIVKGYNAASIWVNGNQTTGILHAWAAIAGGYSVEVAIPWANLGITPSSGAVIGFDIANDDDDNGVDREGQKMWAGTVNNWTDTSAFGDLTLVGTGGTQDTIWVDDQVPTGGSASADGGDSWTWITSNPTPQHGTKAHQSNIAAGEHQHFFTGATATLPVVTGDKMYSYIYIDPANVPSTVMLQWYDETGSWEHRAYWGPNNTGWGPAYQVSSSVPASGTWVRLEVPASAVGLEGHTLNGMAFTLAGGRATWDNAGKSH
jgi:endoglucanase